MMRVLRTAKSIFLGIVMILTVPFSILALAFLAFAALVHGFADIFAQHAYRMVTWLTRKFQENKE